MIYEVWTLNSPLDYDTADSIMNEGDQHEIKQYWSCVESFASEDEAYEYVESLDEIEFPLIHDGKDNFYS